MRLIKFVLSKMKLDEHSVERQFRFLELARQHNAVLDAVDMKSSAFDIVRNTLFPCGSGIFLPHGKNSWAYDELTKLLEII